MDVWEMGIKQDPLFTLDSSLYQAQPRCHEVYGSFLSRGRMVSQLRTDIPTTERQVRWPEPEERRIVMPKSRLIRQKGQPKCTRIHNEMDDEDKELPTSLWIKNGPKLKCGLCRQESHNCHRWPTRNVASTSGGATKEAALQQREVCSSNTVAMSCVAKVPDLRRTMDEVVRMIEKIKQSYSEKQPSSEENNSKDTHNWTP
nr:putative inactive receptor kinase [Quercus suber]